MMGMHISILIVEDSEPDALLLLREFDEVEFDLEYEIVDAPETMAAALDRQSWDVIVADYIMPHFSGLEALRLVQERGLETPVIMVSGKIGDEVAVNTMLAGTKDYVLKSNLARLAPAVKREVVDFRRQQQANKARIQAEESLRKAYDEQEKRVADRTAELLRANLMLNREIFEHKQAEEALRKSEARFRALVTASSNALYSMSPDWGEMSQLKGGSFIADTTSPSRTWLQDYIPPEEHALVTATIDKAIQTRGVFELEHRVRRKDGSVGWTLSRAVPLLNSNGNITEWFGAASDITNLKQAEKERVEFQAQLERTHRLESIGTLAGGIAHDFNNLLAGLFGYLEVARMYADSGAVDKVSSTVRAALEVFGRAKDLTQQLLTFAKGGGPAIKVEDVSKVINDTVALALSGSNVQSRIELQHDLWPCKIDENQVSQALDNILMNAKEAMSGGGTISISAENHPEGASLPKSLSPGNYVQISIADQGPGIPAEILERVFDPFFGTKETGHGLGLSIAYSIIKKHGGTIEIDAKPGAGATVHLFLPAFPEAAPLPVREDTSFGKTARGRILVMDDEQVVRDVVGAMLEGLGYSVILAADGEETITLQKESLKASKPFDVYILDITVRAGLGGKDTIRKLLEVEPQVQAVVTSGYSNDPVMTNPEDYGFRAALTKPFQLKELDDLLRRIMNEAPVAWLRAV